MVKSYKKTYRFDSLEWMRKDNCGSPYDYDISVRYFCKVYFKSDMQLEIEEWLKTNFKFGDVTFYIPEVECETLKIGKNAFSRVLQDDELLQDAVKDAIDSGIAESKKEVMDFINDALATESDDEIVRIEFW